MHTCIVCSNTNDTVADGYPRGRPWESDRPDFETRRLHIVHRSDRRVPTVTTRTAPTIEHRFPGGLPDWHRWHARRRPLHLRIRSFPRAKPTTAILTRGSDAADIVAASIVSTPSLERAVIDPLTHIAPERIAILATRPRRDLCGPDAIAQTVTSAKDICDALPALRCSLTIGAHLEFGALATAAARRAKGRSFVVQHGLLTPWSPPLPDESTLLAWTDDDAAFLTRARRGIAAEVVGSQLLWQAVAASTAGPERDRSGPPTFLGQLHGAEMSRLDTFRTALDFCRTTGATYRPHPAETDRMSRLAHLAMRRSGVTIDAERPPLSELGAGAVAVFSTGLLEGAAAGVPTWGVHARPPVWLSEFWDRYGIGRWGDSPTPAPEVPDIEPARAIAQIVTDSATR